MSDTTAMDGSVDAVAASLIEGPQQEDEQPEELVQPEEGDAESQTDGENVDDEAECAEASDEADDGNDESEADAEQEEPAEQLYTVKVDGREQQVPLNELLRGYSGQAYIQKGMQEVAQVKQEIGAAYEALASERQQFTQFVQAMQTGALPMQPPEPPSEDLLAQDPIGYLEARVRYDKEVVAFQHGQAAMREIEARNAQDQQQAFMAKLQEEARVLAQHIPAFANPETAAKVKKDMIDGGQQFYEFHPEELRSIADNRMIRALNDAVKYRRLMAGKSADAQPNRSPKTQVLKPGVKASPNVGNRVKTEKAKAQMKRTGGVDDVARFLLS